MNNNLLERYSKQIVLRNIGISGQKKLFKSKILIVGAGGLGCSIIDQLSRLGIGEIGIIDKDKVQLSNIHRQNLFDTKDINEFKVNVIKKKILKINPNIKLKIYKEFLNEKNAKKIIDNYNLIIDGSDNFKTKFLINEACMELKKKLIIGAISKFEGHVFTFNFNVKRSPCLKCFYEIIPAENILDCERDGVIGPIANIVGSIQSSEALKMILKIGNNLNGKILILNLLSLNFRYLKYTKKRNCLCKK